MQEIEFYKNVDGRSFDLLIKYQEQTFHANLTKRDFKSSFVKIKNLGRILNGETVNAASVKMYQLKFTIDSSGQKSTLQLTIHPRIKLPEIYFFVLNLVSEWQELTITVNRKTKRPLEELCTKKKKLEDQILVTPPNELS